MKRMEEEGHENSERWLLTYSDLITLLMIFFVIMYAMSSVNSTKYAQLSQSLNSALGSGGGSIFEGNGGSNAFDLGNAGVAAENASQSSLENMKNELNEYLQQDGLDGAVVQLDDRGLAITLKDSILFDSGEAELKPEAKDKLVRIGRILSKIQGYIRVEGHTDNIPIKNSLFQSNWQLSSIRAANVVELLIQQSGILPGKISAVGYGEFRPIGDNSTAEGRASNRRVEIVLVNSKYNDLEQNN